MIHQGVINPQEGFCRTPPATKPSYRPETLLKWSRRGLRGGLRRRPRLLAAADHALDGPNLILKVIVKVVVEPTQLVAVAFRRDQFVREGLLGPLEGAEPRDGAVLA